MKRFLTFATAALSLIVCDTTYAYYHSTGDEYDEQPGNPWHPEVIKIADESEVAALEEYGARILFRRGDILLTLIPTSSPEGGGDRDEEGDAGSGNGNDPERSGIRRRISRSLARAKITLPGLNAPALAEARARNGAEDVLKGIGLKSPYTGKGVVAGFCDIGFDPMHINFTSADGKTSRIRKIVQYKEAQGERVELNTPEEFAAWRTDTLDDNHATHVAGIMAGGYTANGYNGTAPDAEIVATTSQLSDVGLLAGVEEIIAYAKSVGKPAVINLSMGNYTGPHDGSSLFCQYLDRCADDAVIVLSAGNNGNLTCTMQFDFTEESPKMEARLSNSKWDNYDFSGMVDFWCSDSRPVTVTPLIYDSVDAKTVCRLEPMTLVGDEQRSFASADYPAEGFEYIGEEPEKYFKGAMIYEGGVDAENGRYNLQWVFDLHTDITSEEGPWSRYSIGFEIEGNPGQHIDIYPDGIYTYLKQFPWGILPNHKGSFSDLACGTRTVSVGMSNNRTTMFYLDGTEKETGRAPGTITPYSSYGTLIDGRVMPMTVAPGADIISSASTPYIEAHESGDNVNSLVAEIEGKKYYWVENMGTSMSAPYVAGCIATWMEAYPQLSSEDVISIIQGSNRHDYPDPTNPRHGRGWFDALEGMRRVLDIDVSTAIIEESDPLPFRLLTEREGIMVVNPEMKEITIGVYSPDGRLLSSGSDTSDRVLVRRPEGHRGIAIVRVSCGPHVLVAKLI